LCREITVYLPLSDKTGLVMGSMSSMRKESGKGFFRAGVIELARTMHEKLNK
jgi:hypothetical protein